MKTGNGPKKEETDQQTENLQLFLKIGNGPKKRGNGPKKKGVIDQQTESSTHCTQVDNHEFHLLVSCKHMEKHRLSISLRTGQTLSSILHNRAAISKAR